MDDSTILQCLIGLLTIAIFLLTGVVFRLAARLDAQDGAVAAVRLTVSALTEIVALLLEGEEP
jgi:hypothetical protein